MPVKIVLELSDEDLGYYLRIGSASPRQSATSLWRRT
jgi:hypothetical protein